MTATNQDSTSGWRSDFENVYGKDAHVGVGIAEQPMHDPRHLVRQLLHRLDRLVTQCRVLALKAADQAGDGLFIAQRSQGGEDDFAYRNVVFTL